MTEEVFLKQVWRPYDKITTCDGVSGKVLQVAFNTKSVRAFISGAPEWVSCTLIETHTTGNGKDGSEVPLAEQIQKKLDFSNERVKVQAEEISSLQEKLKTVSEELLKNANVILNMAREKKARAEKIENSMDKILQTLERMGLEEGGQR